LRVVVDAAAGLSLPEVLGEFDVLRLRFGFFVTEVSSTSRLVQTSRHNEAC
jgi:hypothetical protein